MRDTQTIFYMEWSDEHVTTVGIDVTTHFHAYVVRQGRVDLLVN